MYDFIKKDYSIKGRYSKRQRQIDVFIKQRINGQDFTTIVESKNYNKKINVKIVESFISMADDIGADYGIMISEIGFTKSALQRAFNNPKDIELDIYNFKEITHNLQTECALPYLDDNMVLILAPMGWIVDAKRRDFPIACFLYKKGLTFDEAISSGEFAYTNFWKSDKDNFSIMDLSKLQEDNISQNLKIEKIEYIKNENVLGKDAMVRIVRFTDYPLIEITGFIRFDEFIFFCVCNTRELYLKRNHRKMQLFLKYILPLKITS
jgi:hypothetical protein